MANIGFQGQGLMNFHFPFIWHIHDLKSDLLVRHFTLVIVPACCSFYSCKHGQLIKAGAFVCNTSHFNKYKEVTQPLNKTHLRVP